MKITKTIKKDENGTLCHVWATEQGVLHREGKRHARIFFHENGKISKKEWWKNGEKHRVRAAADIYYYDDGTLKTQMWWFNGKIHRDGDRPAVINYHKTGSIESVTYYKHGLRHRIIGPALISYSMYSSTPGATMGDITSSHWFVHERYIPGLDRNSTFNDFLFWLFSSSHVEIDLVKDLVNKEIEEKTGRPYKLIRETVKAASSLIS